MRFNSYPITLHSDGCPLHHRRTNCGSQFKRLLLVALLAATGAYGQEVTTSQGLRSLPAFEGLSSENNRTCPTNSQ